MSKISLKSLMTPSKTVAIEFPGLEGFEVDLCYLAREELIKLRSRCVSQKLNRKTRGFEGTLDEDKFLEVYVNAVIKNWSGLKYKYLYQVLLVDRSGQDSEDVLPFTQENAQLLMRNSSDFDTWITESVGDLENFTQNK